MIQQQAKMQAASKPAAARAVARPGFPAIQPSRSARSVGAAASMDRDVQSASAQQPEAFKPAKPLIDMSTPGMTRRQALQSGLAAMAFATCPCCPQPAKAEEWDYGGSASRGVCKSKGLKGFGFLLVGPELQRSSCTGRGLIGFRWQGLLKEGVGELELLLDRSGRTSDRFWPACSI